MACELEGVFGSKRPSKRWSSFSPAVIVSEQQAWDPCGYQVISHGVHVGGFTCLTPFSSGLDM